MKKSVVLVAVAALVAACGADTPRRLGDSGATGTGSTGTGSTGTGSTGTGATGSATTGSTGTTTGGSDGTTTGGGDPVEVPEQCLTDVVCEVGAEDCQSGERCSAVTTPPTCQKLYCAEAGQSCDPTYGNLLCVEGLECADTARPACVEPGGGGGDTGGGQITTTGTDGGECPSDVSTDDDCCTCAPANKCSDGIDNALGAVASLVGDPLEQALADGNIQLLADFGTPGELRLYTGIVVGRACDPMVEENCTFGALGASFGADCLPLARFTQFEEQSGEVTASSTGYLTLGLPLGTAALELPIHIPRLQATRTEANFDGIVGGAIPNQAIIDAVEALPKDALPLDKDTILQLLETTLATDVSASGGPLDASSISLAFEAVPAEIVTTYGASECPDLGDVTSTDAYFIRVLTLSDSGFPGGGLDIDQICH